MSHDGRKLYNHYLGQLDCGTLLCLICERQGWTDESKFFFEETIRNNNDDNDGVQHEGLFQETEDFETPLTLALQTGSDLGEIIDYLRDQHPAYLQANLHRIPKIMAEYLGDMQLLSNLVQWYDDSFLVSSHSSSPLDCACYYQNEEMIRCLLQEYFDYYRRRGEAIDTYNCLLSVQNHLSTLDNQGISPLGHLLLNVGDADAENAWRCVNACVGFFSSHENEYLNDERKFSKPQQRFRFPILHLFLSQTWNHVIGKRNCMKIIDQIVNRLEIDICTVDKETGNTMLSIVIGKLAMGCTAKKVKSDRGMMSLRLLNFFLRPSAASLSYTWGFPLTTRNASGRLPLHIACEHSLPWKSGLESVANANMVAIESIDPVNGLPPFAHCAVGAKSDLNSIYELLRLFPSSIDSAIK